MRTLANIEDPDEMPLIITPGSANFEEKQKQKTFSCVLTELLCGLGSDGRMAKK